MTTFYQQVPSESGVAGDLARQLAALVGPAVEAPDGSVAAAEYLALGGALATARATTLGAIEQAFGQTADDCLGEWEAALALPLSPGVATATRRASILAKLRAVGGTNARLDASATTLAAGSVVVLEPLFSDVATPRYVYRIGLTVPSTLYADAVFRARLDDLLQTQCPSHVSWTVGVTSPFLADDASSLTDRDLLGS